MRSTFLINFFFAHKHLYFITPLSITYLAHAIAECKTKVPDVGRQHFGRIRPHQVEVPNEEPLAEDVEDNPGRG